MCGFAGVVARTDRYRTSRETLAKMSAAIAHRGPDGEGVFFNHEDEITSHRPQCALAFRRLAVLDPGPRSMQPFTIGSKTLVFNGEIYNYRELRSELSSLRPEYAWRTTGDTEVLLMAYEVWGDSCVEHLNGMFAFVVWDEAGHSLYLARDRMGQKPLYYTVGDDRIAFASELSALKCVSFWNEVATVNNDSLVEYLHLGYVSGDRTIYSGVRNLMPSTWLKWNQQQHSYFDRLKPSNKPATVERTRDLMRRAVERQLVSDVPLGVFLSGGIDSSIIAACARRHGPIETFSIGFEDARYDETKFAQAVADHLGTTHHTFRLRPDVIETLPLLARSFGEPFADSSALPTHYLARETRSHVTVALSGDGGDELFGGYERYKALAMTERIATILRGPLAAIGQRLPPAHPKSKVAKLRRLLRSMNQSVGQRYEGYVELFDAETIDELLGRTVNSKVIATRFDELTGCDAVQRAAAVDRLGYLPNDLLAKVDRCSMLFALEVRSPFMDHELVRYAAGLTGEQMIGGGPKRMLREAFAGELPEFVFKRKKMGFAVPIGEWFRNELRSMLRESLFATNSFALAHFSMNVVQRLIEEHQQQRVDHSQRLYALLMLELWWHDQSTGSIISSRAPE